MTSELNCNQNETQTHELNTVLVTALLYSVYLTWLFWRQLKVHIGEAQQVVGCVVDDMLVLPVCPPSGWLRPKNCP